MPGHGKQLELHIHHIHHYKWQCFAYHASQPTAGAAVRDGVCATSGWVERRGVLRPVVVVLGLALHRVALCARAIVIIVLAATPVARGVKAVRLSSLSLLT